jgi:CheY-like chemotaxis protein
MDTAIVVERQKSRQKLITGVLEEQGIQAQVYDEAEEAVRKVEEDVPDLILMDVMMPSLSGFGLLEKLKTLDTKVLLLTDAKPTSRQLSTYGGMDFFVAPLNRKRLAARIIEIKANLAKRPKGTNVPMLDSHALTSHMLVDLHEPSSGRLDAGRIAEYLGIPLSGLSKCLERSVAGVHKSPSAPAIQLLLAPIARSIAILARLLGSRENVRIWVNSPHPDLDGRTPLSVILEGRATVVTEMLEAALAGQPA